MVYKRRKNFNVTRKSHRGVSRFLFWSTTVIFLGVVVYILFFSSFLSITTFKVADSNYVVEDDILDMIVPATDGKILGIVNKNNLFLTSKNKIRKDILEKFRQIRDVEVRKKFPSELDVRIEERVPTMLFRGSAEWFILDENAVAYDTANPEAEEIKKYDLPSLSDMDGKEITIGDSVLNAEYMRYVLDLKKKMKSDTEVEIENDLQTPSLISKDIRVKAKEGWGIYFNENINVDKEIETLNVVLESKIEKSQRPDLEYIDLRIDNKVYYKFREGTPEEIARLAAEEAAKNTESVATPDNTDKKKKK